MNKKRILIVGGTGYLGQHLLQSFANLRTSSSYDLAFTYCSTPPSDLLHAFPQSLSFPLDLRIGDGFDFITDTFGQPDVVVNCAALSVPRACEADPVAAMCINVPKPLVSWISSFKEKETLLIHLSTDQVYEGTKSYYKEEDKTCPVNTYGRSKVAAEEFINSNCSNFAILRSSIIYGPQTISPVLKSLPIQWIDDILSKGNKVDFFYDEFRSPVFINDVVGAVIALTKKWVIDGIPMQLILNLGGPERVSRAQMAKVVAEIRGYDASLINLMSASSVDRGVKSPTDISMDINKLVNTLNIAPISFKDGVTLTLLNR
ncbi:methionine adenosyltransferase 2 subunit beta [Chenopodium quinoa]|uniref:RmlD-like substrate binding domain-containing protein n=1 Tax=Chenopodium quinoa TaxID=63459 RepID=A0A803KZ51_CHEQI|nr:methionine adenosyltransferase 2 subunit beta [Chenopodium quinoa]